MHNIMALRPFPLRFMALFLITAAVSAGAISLPYNPTTILTATNLSFAYIFQPSSQNANQATLSTLDLTASISASQLDPVILNDTFSFLNNDTLQAYLPIIDTSGNITVVAGKCSQGAAGLEAWRFVPKSLSQAVGGLWTNLTSTTSQSDTSDTDGANFLAGGAVFSADVGGGAANEQLYVFGGMCPFANSSAQNWTSAAAYSNTMLKVSPETSGDEVSEYSIDILSSTSGPIPEAGFSMTGLTPTYSADVSGVPKTTQQDFLLIGGQTQTAFINMSSAAVYSLPQQSWNFVSIQQPSSVKTDLAIRQSTDTVEPRSGHTAVLSEDGESVIIFGGWVGDTSNPAMPQLAILTLGSGYGGTGEGQSWSWSIPDQSGAGPAAGSGLYGHGATLLPGGVMMVAGGYSIPASSSKLKRQATETNQQVFLFNTSSNTWIASYTPQASSVTTADQQSGSGPLSSTSEKTGLGVGLGVGLALLIALILFYLWYTRRLKRLEREREQRLTARSSDRSFGNLQHPFLHQGGIDGRGGDYYAIAGSQQESSRALSGGYSPAPQMEQAGSTGLFVDIPSPTRGLRKTLSTRPYPCQAAPRFDDGRVSRGSGRIPPIVEQDDEDEQEILEPIGVAAGMSESERKLRDLEKALGAGPEPRPKDRQSMHTPSSSTSNPFADPASSPNPLGSHPVLMFDEDVVPGGTVRRVPTVVSRSAEGSPIRRSMFADTDDALNWIAYQDAEGSTAIPAVTASGTDNTGRVSPSKTDDRTSSTLSERSHASTTSITRTMSTRTGAILSATVAAAWRAADNPESSPYEERSNPFNSIDDRHSQYHSSSSGSRTRSNTLDTNYLSSVPQAGKSTDSFMTAHTSFVQLQSEGEALLGGSRRDDPYQRAMAAQSVATKPNASTRNAGAAPLSRPQSASSRRQGWMGSLRRALTAMSGSERTNSMLTSSSTSHEDNDAARSSPSRASYYPKPSSSSPRRVVSEGGGGMQLLGHKRGKKDWDEAAAQDDRNDWGYTDHGDSLAAATGTAAAGGSRPEDEWDVEGEAAKRDFQVMFTVPKTRLRVVNADIERASMRSASDSAVSRANSVRSDGPGVSSMPLGGRAQEARSWPEAEPGEIPGLRGASALGITAEEEEYEDHNAEEERAALIADFGAMGGQSSVKGKQKAL